MPFLGFWSSITVKIVLLAKLEVMTDNQNNEEAILNVNDEAIP